MDIHIQVFNVGDADSILVTLTKEDKNLVLLIDGGRMQHYEKIRSEVEKELIKYGKNAPDLVVCSHCDEDHIEGLLLLFDHFKEIKVLWSFDTKQLLSILEKESDVSEHMFPSEGDDSIGSSNLNPREKDALKSMISSALQERQLIEKAIARNIIPLEPIAGKLKLGGWEEIEILGPTEEYYKKLFPQMLDKETIKEEVQIMATESNINAQSKNPCEEFNKKSSGITKVNKISTIIQITAENKKYLFSADAGIDSFYAIPNYDEVLKDIYWLKAPHHGSKNNLNSEIVELMSPQVVAISGDAYISENLVKCMQIHKALVYSTKHNGDLKFKNGVIVAD